MIILPQTCRWRPRRHGTVVGNRRCEEDVHRGADDRSRQDWGVGGAVAKLSIEFETLTGTASFDNLTAHVQGATTAFRTPELEYAIDVDGNRFGDAERRIEGGFYGPEHQEMAGVLNDSRSTVNLMGAFGGTKDD